MLPFQVCLEFPESELKNIISLSKNKKSTVNVGIRLNPNVNAQTIGKISTGRMQDKFGLTFKDAIKIIDKYKNSNSIRFKKVYPKHKNLDYANYLLGICYYEQIVDEKKDLNAIVNAKNSLK